MCQKPKKVLLFDMCKGFENRNMQRMEEFHARLFLNEIHQIT